MLHRLKSSIRMTGAIRSRFEISSGATIRKDDFSERRCQLRWVFLCSAAVCFMITVGFVVIVAPHMKRIDIHGKEIPCTLSSGTLCNNYFDDFSKPRPDLWRSNDKLAHKNSYMPTPDLVFYNQAFSDTTSGAILKLVAGPKICQGSTCTNISAGHLALRTARGYGIYEARLATGGLGRHVFSCFTTTYNYRPWDEIANCFRDSSLDVMSFAHWSESRGAPRSKMDRYMLNMSKALNAPWNHAKDFHTYTTLWYPDQLIFYVDRLRVLTQHQKEHLIPSHPGTTRLIIRPAEPTATDAVYRIEYSSFTAFDCSGSTSDTCKIPNQDHLPDSKKFAWLGSAGELSSLSIAPDDEVPFA